MMIPEKKAPCSGFPLLDHELSVQQLSNKPRRQFFMPICDNGGVA
jgi:hypothetical protein